MAESEGKGKNHMVSIPTDLWQRAEAYAKASGLKTGDFVRFCVARGTTPTSGAQ